MSRLSSIRATLEAHSQGHLLSFHDELDPARQVILLDQLEDLDFDALDELIDRYVRNKPILRLPDDLEPVPYYGRAGCGGSDTDHYREAGEELIRAGKVAAFTVAGGQGTRLGWSGPKGSYPATPVTGKPLFRCFAEQILASQNRYRVTIPWYIMTSPLNDAETRFFFQDNNNFGFSRKNIFMFPQGVLPSFEAETGRLLLADKHLVAVNPDGHGGAINALRASGALEDMAGRGIAHISYFQIDNPLAKVIDPVFIGVHAAAPDSSAEVSSKMVPKAYPQERLGVFCRAAGKTTVIEYSDLPAEWAEQRDADGGLRFGAGSIAIHLISAAFVETIAVGERGSRLPLHRAEKVVAHIDPASGRPVRPEAPNAVKLETFFFDALPLAGSSIVYETSRSDEFAPIKNATGADSPHESRQLQSDRHGAWMEANGVRIPRDADGHVDARIEISPLTALEQHDLARARLPEAVAPGESLVL